jgi:uncharacterized protein (DUF2252 family)
LCGDAHLENFGAFRDEAKKSTKGDTSPVVFDVNDFDEATIGPWRIDVLRLTTSLLLGGRELGANGRRSIELAHVLVDSYVRHACYANRMPPAPLPIAALLARVERRSHRTLLAERTEVVGGERRFTRGNRYTDLPKKLARAAREAFAKYAARVHAGAAREAFDVLDVAFRIAGTGSLGMLRVAVLTRGKGGHDDAWLFDMKEEGHPASAPWIRDPALKPAKRVVTAMRACLEHPPRMIGTTKLDGLSMFVRRLAPQEDKLSLQSLRDEHLEGVASYLGALLGRAHRRGAIKFPRASWSKNERLTVIEQAVILAGQHEGAYLAMSRGAYAP